MVREQEEPLVLSLPQLPTNTVLYLIEKRIFSPVPSVNCELLGTRSVGVYINNPEFDYPTKNLKSQILDIPLKWKPVYDFVHNLNRRVHFLFYTCFIYFVTKHSVTYVVCCFRLLRTLYPLFTPLWRLKKVWRNFLKGSISCPFPLVHLGSSEGLNS